MTLQRSHLDRGPATVRHLSDCCLIVEFDEGPTIALRVRSQPLPPDLRVGSRLHVRQLGIGNDARYDLQAVGPSD